MKFVIITLLSLSMFVACGKWQQDPMSGKSGVAGNGTQTPTIPISPKPTPNDAIRVDVEDFHVFKENNPDSFAISARVLDAGYTLKIEIANMASFPGATFNGKDFSWNPQQGTVTAADDQIKIMPLVVRVTASKPGAPVLVAEKTVSVQVQKIFKTPTIVTIKMANTIIREGETVDATVTVEDPDANMAVPATWPVLQFGGMIGKSSLANFIRQGNPKGIGNNRYEIAIAVDLSTEPELTASKADYGFSVWPVSRFQVAGIAQKQEVTVYSSFNEPVSTWVKAEAGIIGSKFSHQFLIMDPKNEAKLDRNVVFSGLPVGMTAPLCAPISDSVLSCQMTWDIPATQTASTVSFTGTVTYSNTFTADPFRRTKLLSFGIVPSAGGQ